MMGSSRGKKKILSRKKMEVVRRRREVKIKKLVRLVRKARKRANALRRH